MNGFVTKIVVFDSGLGSLSIIRSIQKSIKCEIIYFADQKNFPYGNKSKSELKQIISHTINNLEEIFHPDLIIVGSNTPTLMLNIEGKNIVGVKPPLSQAVALTKTNNIGILATNSAIKSKGLSNYIKNCNVPKKYTIKKIDASKLVELVESGKFLTDKNFCKKIIKSHLEQTIYKNKIDACTLSSTHLPLMYKLLKEIFPNVFFIDPAEVLAKQISKKIKPNKKNSFKIFSSGNTNQFESHLKFLGIKNKVTFLHF